MSNGVLHFVQRAKAITNSYTVCVCDYVNSNLMDKLWHFSTHRQQYHFKTIVWLINASQSIFQAHILHIKPFEARIPFTQSQSQAGDKRKFRIAHNGKAIFGYFIACCYRLTSGFYLSSSFCCFLCVAKSSLTSSSSSKALY